VRRRRCQPRHPPLRTPRLWHRRDLRSTSLTERTIAISSTTGVVLSNIGFRKLSGPFSPLGLSLWITSGLPVIQKLSQFPSCPVNQNLTETRQPIGSAALKNFRFAIGIAGA